MWTLYVFLICFYSISCLTDLDILNVALENNILVFPSNISEASGMTLFHGRIETKSECRKVNATINSTLCTVICGKLEACQVSYLFLKLLYYVWQVALWTSAMFCDICEYGSVTMVVQEKTNDNVVALKVIFNL